MMENGLASSSSSSLSTLGWTPSGPIVLCVSKWIMGSSENYGERLYAARAAKQPSRKVTLTSNKKYHSGPGEVWADRDQCLEDIVFGLVYVPDLELNEVVCKVYWVCQYGFSHQLKKNTTTAMYSSTLESLIFPGLLDPISTSDADLLWCSLHKPALQTRWLEGTHGGCWLIEILVPCDIASLTLYSRQSNNSQIQNIFLESPLWCFPSCAGCF